LESFRGGDRIPTDELDGLMRGLKECTTVMPLIH
jgi:hypothetical protein